MSDEPGVAGMTVNERLCHFGLFSDFDAAVRARDKPAVIGVLLRAQFTPQQAEYTATTVLAAPERYGY